MKALFYGAFALLALLLALVRPEWLVPVLLTAGLSFLLISIVRALINAPRPYEVLGVAPQLPKSTHGRSFPSRHVFCAFTIACCWWVLAPWVSILLLIGACAIAYVRVAGGVHYVRDVVAGALCGIGLSVLGLLCFGSLFGCM